MKIYSLMVFALLATASCKTKQPVDNLPKDITLKPINEAENDKEMMQELRMQIDSLSKSVACTDPADWRIAPAGAKPCGGPGFYLTYHKNVENEILPMIQKYTNMSTAFNKKYGLMSDCAMVQPPTRIRCEDNKAVPIYGSGGI